MGNSVCRAQVCYRNNVKTELRDDGGPGSVIIDRSCIINLDIYTSTHYYDWTMYVTPMPSSGRRSSCSFSTAAGQNPEEVGIPDDAVYKSDEIIM